MVEIKTQDIVNVLVSFLIDRTGNDVFDRLRERRKLEKIIKKDRENIRSIFKNVNDTELYVIIEEFIFFSAFQNATFFSPTKLEKEKEDELWDNFKKYVSREIADKYIDISYKERIIRCVNLHNEAINTILLDQQNNLQLKLVQKQHDNIEYMLKNIIDTLDKNCEYLDEEKGVEYAISQLESIMKSCRYDLWQLRKKEISYWIECLLGFSLLILAVALSEGRISFLLFIIIFIILGTIIFALLFSARNIQKTIEVEEKTLQEYKNRLWTLHYDLLYDALQNKLIEKRQNNDKKGKK